MNIIRPLLAIIFLTSSAANALAQTNQSQAFRTDIEFLFDRITSDYALLDHKLSRGLDLEGLKEECFRELDTVDSRQSFQRLLQRTIARFNDSHFNLKADTKQICWLGFESDLAEGKVIVTALSPALAATEADIRIGDEITSFDGEPVSRELSTIEAYIGKSSEMTVKRYAAMMLGRRFGSVVPLQQGEVRLGLRREPNGKVRQVQLQWSELDSSELPHPYHDRWDSDIEIPDSAVKIEAPSTAWILKSGNQSAIGFLRIPTFMILPKKYDETREAYARALNELQQNSDVLILDLTFNDGGNVEAGAGLLALFMDADFAPYRYRLLASDDELKLWTAMKSRLEHALAEAGSSAAANKKIESGQLAQLNHIISHVSEALGRGDKLTEAISLSSNEKYEGQGLYTRPMVLLVNEFTASAADFFAVHMKDLGRAALVGQSTMSAGSKSRVVQLPNTEIRINMPKIVFCRSSGDAFENVGAKPDHEYSNAIQKDLLQGYSGLREKAVEVARSLLVQQRKNQSPSR